MEGNQPAPCLVALTDGRDCDVAVIRMAAGVAEIAQAPLRIIAATPQIQHPLIVRGRHELLRLRLRVFYANRFADDKLRSPA
jgi:hypothetical protein